MGNRNVILLGVLGLVLILVAFYFLLLGPLLNDLDETASVRDQRQADLAEIQSEVARLEEVRRNSPELQRQLLELNKRIPDQPEVETLVVQIEDIAQTAGVTQTEIVRGDPEPPEGGGDFTVQPITMSFEGTYEELLEFLLLADDLVRLMAVNSVSYEVAEEGTTAAPDVEQNLAVEIEAEVYFQPTDVPEGTAPLAPAPTETTAGPETEGTAGPEAP
jgi:type IV pilus assembly protein PilO